MSKHRNPRLNSSGYMDMTAFYAIRSADREIKKKKRNTPKGQKARKNQGSQPLNHIENNGGIPHE